MSDPTQAAEATNEGVPMDPEDYDLDGVEIVEETEGVGE